jgi:hypothetical protein
MQDFWQILGRIAADSSFRAMVTANTAGKTCAPSVTKPDGLLMNGNELAALQSALDAKTEGPISLFAVSETMRIGTNATFTATATALNNAVTTALNGATPSRREFFMTLGAMTISGTLRDSIAQAGIGVPIDYSAGEENQHLVKIARNASFVNAATDSCNKLWTPGCGAAVFFYPKYLHPNSSFAV